MKTRIIAMLLVLSMLVLSLASCGGKSPEVTEGNGAGTISPSQEESKWNDVNFNGESIIISLSTYENTTVVAAGATNSINYIQGPDAYTTDAVQNAVYDRNRKVEKELGLNVTYQSCDLYNSNPDNTLTVIEGFVLADLDDSPDVVNTMSYGVIRAGIKGHLYNALSTDRENYFDLTADGWYSDLMYENTLDQSKIYMLAGDYFIDVLRYGYGILVNLDMYDEVFASEGGSESLFELIEEGGWTFDEFKRLVQMAYVDEGTIGQLDVEDTFGAINQSSWLVRATFSTSGLDTFTTDENGNIAYVSDITDIHNFVDYMIDLTRTEGFYLNVSGGPNRNLDATSTFIKGKSLFATDSLILCLEGTLLQSMDDKVGLVPYPKYNPEREYGSLVSDNGNVGGILYNSDKFTECSAYLQMATEESNNGKGTLIYEYYDVTLKYKLSATPAQVTMLELIRNGLCSPKSFLFDNYFAKSVSMNTYGALINSCLASGSNTFASDWESQYSAVQGSLESTIATYGQQD